MVDTVLPLGRPLGDMWNSGRKADDRIMPARRFNEGDIDFEVIDADLAKLVAPKLSLKDVLDRLRERLLEQRAKGVTVAQMHGAAGAEGCGNRCASGDAETG